MQRVHLALCVTRSQADAKDYISTWASIVAQSLTLIWNFARISVRQESARINAFYYVMPRPQSPWPGLRTVGAANIQKNIKLSNLTLKKSKNCAIIFSCSNIDLSLLPIPPQLKEEKEARGRDYSCYPHQIIINSVIFVISVFLYR